MAAYIIDGTLLQGLADALRNVNGDSRTYTPAEMIEAVTTIMESATYILVDEEGKEYPAVFVEKETVFTATANDIRVGTVAATAEGVTVGTKEIPAYHTTEGYRLIPSGSACVIPLERYDFTKLQAIICDYAGSVSGSVAAEKVVIGDGVFAVNSTEQIAAVTKDAANNQINLGITNESESSCLIRYLTYKEII